jgi:4-carboxymuconolactone decarboxylase
MAITESARRNHEKLFPNHRSTLKITDPEFIEVFDNFAFDEIASRGSLDEVAPPAQQGVEGTA